MRKIKKLVVLLMVVVFTFTSVFAATPGNNTVKNQPAGDKEKHTRFIVRYKDGNQPAQFAKKLKKDLKGNRRLKGNKHEVLETKQGMSIDELLEKIDNAGLGNSVEYVQEDNIIDTFEETSGTDVVNEQTVFEEVYVDTGLESAWEFSMGENTVIGVIDTGIDIYHEDLKNNIWVNSDEISGDGIDQDGNGYVDDVNGWNFVDEDNLVYDAGDYTDEEHGTAIAGIIAAEKGNGKGMVGVAPKAKVLPLKVFKDGQAYTSDILEAIEYCKSNGIDIVNCSWGSSNYNQALKDEISDSEILFICAAGNNGADLEQNPVYPACFGIDNIINTTSVNKDSSFSSFSNYNSLLVDVAALGDRVNCTVPEDKYAEKSGTSMSAAVVSGTAALVQSGNPQMSISEIKSRITGNACSVTDLEGKVKGGSLLSYAAAVSGNIELVEDDKNTTVSDAVYSDNLGFSLLSMEEGYSAPQDTTESVFSLPTDTQNGQMRMSILGNTLINTLSDAGNFEKDVNSDGGADNWTFGNSAKNGLSTESVIDDYAQSVKANGTNSLSKFYIQLQNINVKEKPGTYYFVSGYVNIKNNENMTSSGIIISPNGGNTFYDSTIKKRNCADISKLNSWQKVGTAFKTRSDMSESYYMALAYLSGNTANAEFLVDGMCSYEITEEEYNNLTVDELLGKYDYVENTKSTNGKVIESVGKNLIDIDAISSGRVRASDGNLEYASYISNPLVDNNTVKFSINSGSNHGISTDFIRVNENDAYTVSSVYNGSNFDRYRVGLYDINKNFLGYNDYTNNLSCSINTSTACYIRISWMGKLVGSIEFSNFQLEKETSTVVYEPYYNNMVDFSDIELRSLPNGIRDEIDINNGLFINRVGQDVLDGSEDWVSFSSGVNTTGETILGYIIPGYISETNAVARCNNSYTGYNDDFVYPSTFSASTWQEQLILNNDNKLYLYIKASRLSGATLQDFKNYLANKPITLMYQLCQPIVSDIDTQPLTCFEDGTVIVKNAVKDTAYYSYGITIDDKDLPIKRLDSIYEISGASKIPVSLSNVEVASDGLSFTISGAKNGTAYEYEYEYGDELSTVATIRYSVPTDSTSQSNSNIEAIKSMQAEIDSLEQRVNALEALIKNSMGGKVVEFQYDSNGNLIKIISQ